MNSAGGAHITLIYQLERGKKPGIIPSAMRTAHKGALRILRASLVSNMHACTVNSQETVPLHVE